MMNWPTAFVIAVAICAGAFLYNKPSDAAFGGSDHHSMLLDKTSWVQFDGNSQRVCYYDSGYRPFSSNAPPGKPSEGESSDV